MMKDMPLEEIRTGPLPSRDPSGGREDLCSPPDSLVLPFRWSERLLDLYPDTAPIFLER